MVYRLQTLIPRLKCQIIHGLLLSTPVNDVAIVYTTENEFQSKFQSDLPNLKHSSTNRNRYVNLPLENFTASLSPQQTMLESYYSTLIYCSNFCSFFGPPKRALKNQVTFLTFQLSQLGQLLRSFSFFKLHYYCGARCSIRQFL